MPELRENTAPPAFRIPINYTDEEFEAYGRLMQRIRRSSAGTFPYGPALAVGFVLALIGGFLAVASRVVSSQGGGFVAVLVFGGFWSGVWTVEILGRRRQRRAHRVRMETMREWFKNAAILVTSRGIFMRSPFVRNFYTNGAIRRISRDGEMVLLWTGPESAIVIPARLLTAGQLDWLLKEAPKFLTREGWMGTRPIQPTDCGKP